jgi:cystathionine beta-lyase/cystathionine gamma-synthase
MERETRLAHGRLPGHERATIQAYVDGTPGPFYYQRIAHPVGLETERLVGELEGGHALLFSSGAGATTALMLALLEPGATVAVADGGYWGTVALLRGEFSRWGEARARWEGTRVPPGLLRLSVGLEDVEDLWADLALALDT